MIALALVLAAAAPPKLAMPDWTRVDVTQELASFYADHLAVSLRAKKLSVVTSQEIASILGVERQKELLGCSDASSCMAELGNALGCDAVVRVSVARIDNVLRANISVLSSTDGTMKVETSVAADGQEKFFAALDDAAGLLAEKLIPPPVMTGGRIRKLSWMPAAAFVLSLGLGIAGEVLAGDLYRQLDGATTYDGALAIARNGTNAKNFGAAMFVVAGVCAAGAVLMYLLGGPVEVTPSVGVTSQSVALGVSGRW